MKIQTTINLLIVCSVLLIACHEVNADTITFEGMGIVYIENVGEFIDVNDYRFTLTADISNGFVQTISQTNIIEPNTTKLFVANHSEITLTRIDAMPFNLYSLDLAG